MRMRPIASLFAAALILSAGPARAASVTYDFIEAAGSPNPGTVGAFITFASPPAEPNMGWTLSALTDILAVQVTDSAIGPVGAYTPSGFVGVGSATGALMDFGAIETTSPAGDGFTFAGQSTPGLASIDGLGKFNPGTFALAVPEPSSLVLAGTAALAGLGAWARRRRKAIG